MKKLLALVLALVMTLGLATVAANASYPDADSIDLEEAADVMTAVGVFQGDEKGNFAPKANLDRAAAAKLIAYLALGEKAAEALPSAQLFSDVPASSWAAKYIGYCANNGYVAGVGGGKFNPSGELTGYAFGKMILCVLGYDAAVEGFTGSAWSINVAKLMDKKNIADGVDGDASAVLTREQAAQYCFNALQQKTVEYDSKGTSIEINGAKIATGASKAEDTTKTLADERYGTDLAKTTTKNDAFGAPASEWKYKKDTYGPYANDADYSYTGKVTKGTVYSDLGSSLVDDLKDGTATMTVWTDGDDATVAKTDIDTYAKKNNSGAAFGTGKGVTTDIYVDDDNNTVTVVVKNTYLMKATADYNAKTEKLAVEQLVKGSNLASLKLDDYAGIEDYKKDDFILYNLAGAKIKNMQKAEVVSGKVDSYRVNDSVVIDGTKYSYSAKAKDDVEHGTAAAYKTNETATVVLDAQDNIIYVDELTVANDDILFVVGVNTSGFTKQAQVVTVDGKKMVVDLTKKSVTPSANEVYLYEVKSGAYELSEYADEKWDALKAGDYSFYYKGADDGVVGTATGTGDTVYIVENDDEEITVYTGVKNAPEKVKASAVVYVKDDNDLTYVYAKASEVEMHSTDADEMIYVLEVGNTAKPYVDNDGNKYIEIKALVDGTETTLQAEASITGVQVGKLYTKQSIDSDGYVKSLTAASGADYVVEDVDGEDPFTYKNEKFTYGTDSKFVKTDKAYVIVTNDAKLLLNDEEANYEVNDMGFSGVDSFAEDYDIESTVTLVLDDGEIVEAYIYIDSAAEPAPAT